MRFLANLFTPRLVILALAMQPNLTQEEAVNIIQMCVNELKVRFLINQSTFKLKIVDKDGIRVLDDMHPTN
jgi:20S proteasome subunit beta 4